MMNLLVIHNCIITLTFFMKDDKSLEKYNKIWDKVNNSNNKVFESEPAYNEKCLKTKIKSYGSKINTINT